MHILLKKSKKYKPKTISIPNGYEYSKYGYWYSISDNQALITSKDSFVLVSKKEDIETGEDQKGE